MKKKFIVFGIIACLGLGLQSCTDYLDVQRYFTDRQDLNRIFNSRDYTEQWLANAYYQLLDYNLEIGHSRFALTNFSDDMIYTEGGSGISYSQFRFGQYGPQYGDDQQRGRLVSQPWIQSYQGIRQASIAIENLHVGDEIDRARYEDYLGQAYFIRAYCYWLLLRKYGPVPIMPEEGLDYEDSYENLALPRNTYDECVEYISEQMLLAAKYLPLDRTSLDASRPTRGAALAVRAKAYLYAASPLVNGNTDMANFVNDQGKPVIPQTYDEAKWAKAAAATLDVINLGKYTIHTVAPRSGTNAWQGAYPATVTPPRHPVYSDKNWPEGWNNVDPLESYRSLFNGDLYVADNRELIFSRGNNQLQNDWGIISMTQHEMPEDSGSLGFNCHGITGKMCDAYAMNTGEPFVRVARTEDEARNYFTTSDGAADTPNLRSGVWREYANREPRFYASVAHSGTNWPLTSTTKTGDRNKQVHYYYGLENGRAQISTNDRWIPTGIGMVKYVNPKESFDDGQSFQKVDPVIRYADILLMYAECMNELTASHDVPSWDGQTYTISRDIDKMKAAVLPIRLRGGVPNYDDIYDSDPYQDAGELRKLLKQERMIEFLGENQRYYDLRRWKDAPAEEGAPIIGCNTTITSANRHLFYEQVVVPSVQTAFSDKLYWWPLPWEELRRNRRLTQAPGWPSFD